ncbi:MAG: NUDIX hydrolase [Candidatus Levybacteria bacterium]|nr:NUDIX hydrolase [Candidatus Levybacteria bacterium]
MRDEKVVYKGKIFTITEYEIVDNKGVKHTVEKGYRPDIVTIIGMTKDNKILMIKEFRAGSKDYILWLPGGRVKKNENFKRAALREFEEETGYTTRKLTLFHKRQPSDNFSGEGRVFLAKDIRLSNSKSNDGDEEGRIIIIKLSLSKLVKMALKSKIPNEFFSYLILRLNYLVQRGKLEI